MRYDENKKREEELDELRLRFEISDDSFHTKKQFEQMRELMENIGIHMNFYPENKTLVMSVYAAKYLRTTTRKAGRREKIVRNNDGDACFYHYSDIVYMLQSMSDQEIIDKCGMARPTFYRHKKKMLESRYYKSLDQDRLNDLEYLKSLNGDTYF